MKREEIACCEMRLVSLLGYVRSSKIGRIKGEEGLCSSKRAERRMFMGWPHDRRTGGSEESWSEEGSERESRQRESRQSGSQEGQTQEVAHQKASEYAEQGREKAVGQLATQKERASSELGGVARALRTTGEQLQEQEQDSVARYVNQAAEQTERLSEYLSERDANELVREVEDFARNRPAVFLGGAFAIGIAAARFLKSSAGQREALEIDAGAATSGSDRSAVRLGEETSQG
jgi:hypothetical protein